MVDSMAVARSSTRVSSLTCSSGFHPGGEFMAAGFNLVLYGGPIPAVFAVRTKRLPASL